MLSIKKNITNINYKSGNISRVKYIVIHFTANNGDTAYNNTKYFKDVYRGASAHYFVDENAIYQSVLDKDVAWHVGANKYYHSECRNSNAIGIEMCSRIDSSGKYYFKDATVNNTIKLVQYLMKKYNVPISRVIRHYDVTHKNCPEPYVRSSAAWTKFKERVSKVAKNNTVPSFAKGAWDWGKKNGLVDGTRPNDNLTRAEFMVVLLRFYKFINK